MAKRKNKLYVIKVVDRHGEESHPITIGFWPTMEKIPGGGFPDNPIWFTETDLHGIVNRSPLLKTLKGILTSAEDGSKIIIHVDEEVG